MLIADSKKNMFDVYDEMPNTIADIQHVLQNNGGIFCLREGYANKKQKDIKWTFPGPDKITNLGQPVSGIGLSGSMVVLQKQGTCSNKRYMARKWTLSDDTKNKDQKRLWFAKDEISVVQIVGN